MPIDPRIDPSVDTEQLPLLLRLLDEYSEKLQAAQRAIERLALISEHQGAATLLPLLGIGAGVLWPLETEKGGGLIGLILCGLIVPLAIVPFLFKAAQIER